MSRNSRTAIVSPEFEGGGAERVLSLMVNNNLGKGYSLSNRVSYIQDEANVQYISEPNIRVYRWFKKATFLWKILLKNEVIVTSDFPVLFFLRLISRLTNKALIIVYRPSIDANYLNIGLRKVVGGWFSRKILHGTVNDILIIYQTKEIKESFAKLGIKSLSDIVVNNPFSGVIFAEVNRGEGVNRVAFIGRATIEKGYDRFYTLAKAEEMEDYDFEHFGVSGIDLEFKSDNIIEHGWMNLEEICLKHTAVVVPSRLEGFPNIILELVFNGIKPIVSTEVANYFSHITDIHGVLLIVDFERNNYPEMVGNILKSNKMYLTSKEINLVKSSLISAVEYIQITQNFINGYEEI